MRRAQTLIVVFAKAPQAGRVKTRLAPRLGAAGAARLHMRLLRRALATAQAARCGPVELHVAAGAHGSVHAPAAHAWLRSLGRRAGVVLRPQIGADLGTRMQSAFTRGLRMYRGVILIGSDCPALQPADLRRAARLLAACDAVVAPAEDGGYPLLALRRCSPRLFESMPWGGATVMLQTRERLAALGWRWRELRMLWDVDRPEDLERLEAARPLAGRA